MGHSYGGYSVVALITRTVRFRAALASTPWGINMTSIYKDHIGWCETGQARLNGTPWDQRDAYIENSPFFYLDRVTTPLLLVCGTGDPAAVEQAEETFAALRRLGRRVELRLYEGEGHGPSGWSSEALSDMWTRGIEWFHGYLKGV
jgi:dipeptidyl aminopeptidase/acylaminoacyl peptidase